MARYRGWLLLTIVAGLLSFNAGCHLCSWCGPPPPPPLPHVLPASPTLDQIIQAVNHNNSQIHSFSANEAKLSGKGFPTLRANVAFQRPGRLRLRADLFSGPEMDLGSNEELFWFWVKRNQPPAVYYCRHNQFTPSAARQMTPIEPQWLIEAMGIAELDPSLPHQGPFPLSGGRYEIRTIRETPEGPATKVTVINATSGVVLEQRVFDSQGRLLANSVASEHYRDAVTQLIMPRVVEINCPPAQISMRIDLGNVLINRLTGNPAELWVMPAYQGSPAVDMCQPGFQPPLPQSASGMRSRTATRERNV